MIPFLEEKSCSKCNGPMTPVVMDAQSHKLMRGCPKCREKFDVTEEESSKYPKHEGCGGPLCSVMAEDFITQRICLKCGVVSCQNVEEEMDNRAFGKA